MSKTKTGTNAQFTSAGKGLTVIGNHCYAYSGDVPIAQGATVTFFDFTTGKNYIKGLIQVGRNVKTSAETAEKTRLLVVNRDCLEPLKKRNPKIAAKLFLNLANRLQNSLKETDERLLTQKMFNLTNLAKLTDNV